MVISNTIPKGARVQWDWSSGSGQGKVIDIFYERVTRRLQDSEITRDGSRQNPAYLIEQEGGGRVLKLQSEIREIQEV